VIKDTLQIKGQAGITGFNPIINPTQNPQWGYVWQNLNLLVDLVLPSDDIREEYQAMFMSPGGINYPFTRYFVQMTQIGSLATPTNGMQQIVVNFKLRSVRFVYVVLTDPLSDTNSGDYTSYNFPSLSSFMMGGLYEAYLQVGGETYPGHRYKFDTAVLQNNHIPEILATMGVDMATDYAPQYHVSRLVRDSRNYLACGQFDTAIWSTSTAPSVVANAGTVQTYDMCAGRKMQMRDTSRFVLAFDLAKLDLDQMSGADVAQGTGAMVLYLNFAPTHTRPLTAWIIGKADSVFTLQESTPLIRV